jgi:hypothetical protein
VEKGEAGPRTREGHGKREARWRGRKMGCHALAQRRCRSGEWSRDGEGGIVEREHGGERRRRGSAVERGHRELSRRCSDVSFFFFFL